VLKTLLKIDGFLTVYVDGKKYISQRFVVIYHAFKSTVKTDERLSTKISRPFSVEPLSIQPISQ